MIEDGLVAAWDFTQPTDPLVDVVNGITLTPVGGASVDTDGLLCNADGEGATVTAPAALRITGGNISFGFNADILGVLQPNYTAWGGVLYDNVGSNPYWAYGWGRGDSGGEHWLQTNNAGTYLSHAVAHSRTSGLQHFLCIVANDLRTAFRNGVELGTPATGTIAAPQYDASALMMVGDITAGRNVNTLFKQFYVWNQNKAADEAEFDAAPDGAGWAFGGGGGAAASDMRRLPRGLRRGVSRGVQRGASLAMERVNGLWRPKPANLILPPTLSLAGV